MKRTSGLIVAAVGILVLGRAISVRMPHTASSNNRTTLSKATAVPAEDAGDDDDGADSDDAE